MSPVLAYIGPGAGIAFAGSFLSLSWIFWFVAISTASALVFNRYA
jgi:hypothetical protein